MLEGLTILVLTVIFAFLLGFLSVLIAVFVTGSDELEDHLMCAWLINTILLGFCVANYLMYLF